MKLFKLSIPTIFIVPALLALVFQSCDTKIGSGEKITETREGKDFHAIELNTSADIEVTTDSVFSIIVTCEENIIDDLETEVEDGVLKIYFDRNVIDADVTIKVSAPNWDGFDINGSGNIEVKKPISGTKLTLKVSGSGDIEVNEADFEQAKIVLAGSGNIEIDGTADELDVTVSGSGDVEALDLPVKTANATVSGSGDIRLDVSTTLEATISGSGDIEYQGDPTVIKQISGSGSVRKI